MRYVSTIAIVYLVTATSAAFCQTPPAPQFTDQQQQIMDAQLSDDQKRTVMEEFANKASHSDESIARIAADRVALLGRAREARAASYLSSTGLTLPLPILLTETQRFQLTPFTKDRFNNDGTKDKSGKGGVFESTQLGDLVRTALIADQNRKFESEAKIALQDLQLKSLADELSEAQLAQLIDFDKRYPLTEASLEAKLYLNAHRNRRIREAAQAAGLFDSENNEQLASRRLADVQEKIGTKDSSHLRRALAEIIEDYPGTQAERQSNARLAEFDAALRTKAARLKAKTEQTRSIREYWDNVYPSRVGTTVRAQ